MNSNVSAFSKPHGASHSAVNLRAFSEVNNDGDEAAFAGIVGQSSGLRNVLRLVEMVAETNRMISVQEGAARWLGIIGAKLAVLNMVVVAAAIALYPTIVVRAHSANSSSNKTFD